MSPPLTTIRQPRTMIGKHAMALLLELLSDGRPAETEILLRPDLVVRNSVSSPAKGWGKR
jgi:LacI family repressor for deo operon, udp, cdd, tsx, nupC, and nupG